MIRRSQSMGPLATILILLGSQASSALTNPSWSTFAANGMTVQYPPGVFSIQAGASEHQGMLFFTPDKRARLEIFTLANQRGETPAQFLGRIFPDDRRQLHYDRVARNFFAVSQERNGRVLYRRCNFVDSGVIHCIDLQYPLSEKRAWDDIVTRVSLSLRPR
jgi:hypothetical protein